MIKTIKKALGMSYGEDYVGTISTFAGHYAPLGYMDCNGQSLSVRDYPALYAVIGAAYGGDTQTFKLPDLRPFTQSQPDMGHRQRRDWAIDEPRQCICFSGVFPTRG